MVNNSRFPNTAYWQSKKIVENGEKIGANTKAVPFRCAENTLKNKTASIRNNISTETTATVSLRTDEALGKLIDADDSIIYLNYSYSVVSVSAVRSIAGLGAKEYILLLK